MLNLEDIQVWQKVVSKWNVDPGRDELVVSNEKEWRPKKNCPNLVFSWVGFVYGHERFRSHFFLPKTDIPPRSWQQKSFEYSCIPSLPLSYDFPSHSML